VSGTPTVQPLRLVNVNILLAGRPLITGLNATVAPGQCLTVMGPSGCGKSTLLAYVAGTLSGAFKASGSVQVGATELNALPPEQRGVGILFQDDLLFPHLSVGGNLAFALPRHVQPRAQRLLHVQAALQEAGLPGFAARDPATLSGGQRARVALMRTLLAQPRVLLLDEPFNKLDTPLRGSFRHFVLEHARQRALQVLMVTHDQADAAAAGGPVIYLGAA
jgi:putative thiamine transport system ATP-binding protein